MSTELSVGPLLAALADFVGIGHVLDVEVGHTVVVVLLALSLTCIDLGRQVSNGISFFDGLVVVISLLVLIGLVRWLLLFFFSLLLVLVQEVLPLQFFLGRFLRNG